ncbi:MAG: tetratricopeptide repeat protein, partial [Synergistaceae bacterium]|nr:tetratricopeptide repeat protein [Synergistaceae bacterium]
MANRAAPNRGGRPRREYTPEERRAIERRRRAERERRQRRNAALIAVCSACVVAVSSVCVWYFGSVKPNDNYDAQMRVGVENFNAGKYERAEDAFLQALTKRPNDPDALVALSDAYAAEGKYDDAIRGMNALQGVDSGDVRSYERLISWYVGVLKDMASANKQILAAYERQLALTSELISPAPAFDPEPGDYDAETSFAIKAGQGLTVYYSTDGSVPTPQNGKEYAKKISLKNNKETMYTAVAYDQYGLMSWPATARYSLTIRYGVDTSAVAYLGDTARSIMDSVGPLYYTSYDEGGYYYHDETEACYYVFPSSYFTIEEETTDGSVEISA